jgi:hypothetical protein
LSSMRPPGWTFSTNPSATNTAKRFNQAHLGQAFSCLRLGSTRSRKSVAVAGSAPEDGVHGPTAAPSLKPAVGLPPSN